MVDYDPFDESILDEPFDVYKRLRDEEPAYYREDLDCWFISRFGDIWEILSHQERLTSARGTTTTHLLTHQTPNAPILIYRDILMVTESVLSSAYLVHCSLSLTVSCVAELLMVAQLLLFFY